MANYKLLRNVLRIHELIAESKPGKSLTKSDIALALKLRIVSPLSLSDKQIDSAITFLSNLGYPVQYDATQHRWFYNWDPNTLHPTLLETFTKRYGSLPKPTFAVLLMLRNGLDSLVGTPLWGDVREFFESLLETDLWKQTRDMGEVFSIRPREGSSIAEGVFQLVAEAVYERAEVELVLKQEGDAEEAVHIVEPYHLTMSQGIWHLVAKGPCNNVLRTFDLPSIKKAFRTGRDFQEPPASLVKDYLRNSFGTVVRIDAATGGLI